MGLIGLEGLLAVKDGDQRQIVAALAAQEVRAGLQIDHALDFALHAVEILHQLGNLALELILDLEHYDVPNHVSFSLRSMVLMYI